ncbi:helix-turn-helix domain-containing protein [Reinekea marinisedimentorum]|uniref:Transcriptional regulator with XRE-family HTH domain n=1 Tax=Reinekea marinisedimentorum TaxID=230495 RepID=A0A4R3ICZ7_9GAMM|nr:XRE family transcriptional regulator [Reinekea marinisedimentorum]TCS43297.1 transcriptional regulator with XRE-family HTH domain [Reinekea marinisedimentorum]
MSEPDFKAQTANHLKAIRKQKGLSLSAAAELTGVSKAMLGQIERQESSPTIATLWKIASGLETSFSAFFADEPALRNSARAFPADEQMKVTTLFPFQADTGIEMFEITLTGHHRQLSSAHSPGVVEMIHVLHGELQVRFDDQWQPLTAGESVRFFADQPHGYEAVSETCVFQDIVCYPKL